MNEGTELEMMKNVFLRSEIYLFIKIRISVRIDSIVNHANDRQYAHTAEENWTASMSFRTFCSDVIGFQQGFQGITRIITRLLEAIALILL